MVGQFMPIRRLGQVRFYSLVGDFQRSYGNFSFSPPRSSPLCPLTPTALRGRVLRRICAQRTDADSGWGLNLVVDCRPKHQQPGKDYYPGRQQSLGTAALVIRIRGCKGCGYQTENHVLLSWFLSIHIGHISTWRPVCWNFTHTCRLRFLHHSVPCQQLCICVGIGFQPQ